MVSGVFFFHFSFFCSDIFPFFVFFSIEVFYMSEFNLRCVSDKPLT